MADYIRREDASRIFSAAVKMPEHLVDACWVLDTVESIPAADVRPVVHAHLTADGACSACGSYMPTDTRRDAIFGDEVHFCYYCGAQMDDVMREVQDG